MNEKQARLRHAALAQEVEELPGQGQQALDHSGVRGGRGQSPQLLEMGLHDGHGLIEVRGHPPEPVPIGMSQVDGRGRQPADRVGLIAAHRVGLSLIARLGRLPVPAPAPAAAARRH